MKLVKKFAVTVIFVSALAVPTFAGDLETPGKTSVPPSNSTTGTSPAAPSSTTEVSSDLLYEAYMAMLGLY